MICVCIWNKCIHSIEVHHVTLEELYIPLIRSYFRVSVLTISSVECKGTWPYPGTEVMLLSMQRFTTQRLVYWIKDIAWCLRSHPHGGFVCGPIILRMRTVQYLQAATEIYHFWVIDWSWLCTITKAAIQSQWRYSIPWCWCPCIGNIIQL